MKQISIRKSSTLLLGLIVLGSFFSNCQVNTQDDSVANLLLARFVTHRDRIRLLGTVSAPGPVRNAKLTVLTLPASGTCASGSTISPSGKILTEGFTGESGEFSLAYVSEGTPVCIVATPDTDSRMSFFNTNNSALTTLTWSGEYSLTAIFVEPQSFNSPARGVDGLYKIVNISPFTSIVERRFWGLKALSPGLPNSQLISTANSNTMVTTFRGLTGLLEENEPGAEKYSIRLNAFAHLADKANSAANGVITSADLNTITEYMREDFSDGAYDGKKVDPEGNSVNLTVPAVVTSASTFLSVIFKAAVDEYITSNSATLPDALKLEQTFCDSVSTCN